MARREPHSTQRPERSRSGPRLSISNVPIRHKVTLVLLAPLTLAAILGGVSVMTSKTRADRAEHSAAQIAVIHPVIEYAAALNRQAVVSQLVNEFSDPAFRQATADVKEAAAKLEEAAKSPALTDEITEHVEHILHETSKATAGEGFESLENALSMTDTAATEVGKMIGVMAGDMLEPEPQLEMVRSALEARLELNRQQAIMGATTALPEDTGDLFAALGAEHLALTQLNDQATTEGHAEHFAELLFLLNTNEQRAQSVSAGVAPSITERSTAPFDSLIPTLLEELNEHLGEKAADAQRTALLTLLAAVLAVGLAVLLGAVVARRIVSTIDTVRDETLDVATNRLPEAVRRIRAGEDPGEVAPLTVTTTEETGQMARAVDSLHQQAVRLAVEEAEVRDRVAVMFTTLSRRNTSLVNQQLGVIETLERDEQDPDRLEHLFRLDHLAARMRRNAQSLVILADAPVRNVDPTPISVNEAVMAALGGVQDYQRVDLEPTAAQLIAPAAASDVVHVVSELLDNALAYSPPTTTVKITTEPLPKGVRIVIADAGLGMKPQDLARAQESLRSVAEASAETARRMGLFVVSRLSHRHGLEVHLDTNEMGGITATVDLPSSLLSLSPEQLEEQAAADAEPAVNPLVLDAVVGLPTVADEPVAPLESSPEQAEPVIAMESPVGSSAVEPELSTTSTVAAVEPIEAPEAELPTWATTSTGTQSTPVEATPEPTPVESAPQPSDAPASAPEPVAVAAVADLPAWQWQRETVTGEPVNGHSVAPVNGHGAPVNGHDVAPEVPVEAVVSEVTPDLPEADLPEADLPEAELPEAELPELPVLPTRTPGAEYSPRGEQPERFEHSLTPADYPATSQSEYDAPLFERVQHEVSVELPTVSQPIVSQPAAVAPQPTVSQPVSQPVEPQPVEPQHVEPQHVEPQPVVAQSVVPQPVAVEPVVPAAAARVESTAPGPGRVTQTVPATPALTLVPTPSAAPAQPEPTRSAPVQPQTPAQMPIVVASRQAAKPEEPVRTASGLPIRQRGNRPVPGGSVQGSTNEQSNFVRDAEALRARLSAHVAGVTRGRANANQNSDS